MLSGPGSVNVTISPASLTAGTYTGAITITAATTAVIPVTLIVSAVQQAIALTENALTFTAVAGGGTVPAQTFGIANAGAGLMDWSVSSSVTDTGNWLSVSPNSGNTDAASQTVPLVLVAVNAANLTAGQYSGQIKVQSASANNSPEYVSVFSARPPAGSNPGAVVLPAGLIFTQAVGGAAPGSQTITVSNLAEAKLTFATQAETSDGANWLSVTPANGTATSSLATTVTVNVSSTGLAAGTRQGIVTLFFEDGSVRTVNVVYDARLRRSDQPTHGSSPSCAAGFDGHLYADQAFAAADFAGRAVHRSGGMAEHARGPSRGRLRQSAGERNCRGFVHQQ